MGREGKRKQFLMDFAMTQIPIEVPSLPEKHGLWFRRGVVDGLMGYEGDKAHKPPSTHAATYSKGLQLGNELKAHIGNQERKPRRRPRS